MSTQRNEHRMRLILLVVLMGWIAIIGGLVWWRVSVDADLTELRTELHSTKTVLQAELDRKNQEVANALKEQERLKAALQAELEGKRKREDTARQAVEN